jgi:hypothetical protein
MNNTEVGMMTFPKHIYFWKFVLLVITIFLPNTTLYNYCLADTLCINSLSEQSKLAGKILDLKNGILSVLCDNGLIANIQWKDVLALSVDDKVFVTLDTQETIFGRVTVNDGKIYIDSQSMGITSLDFLKVVSLERKRKEIQPAFTVSPTREFASVRGKGTPLTAPQLERGAETPEKKENQSQQEKKVTTIGEKPSEINPEEMFLRQARVFVPKGKTEIELNLTYSNLDRSAPLLGPDKVRSLITSITARYGITNTLLGFVTAPFVANWRETQENITEATRNYESTGIGDISFGVGYQTFGESLNWPAMMLSLIAKSDTGRSPYETAAGRESLGTGHWTLSPAISLVRTIDPVVLFGSLYYTYVFPNTINRPPEIEAESERVEAKPGDSVNLSLGVGFSLNEKVALSFRILGSYIFRDRIAGGEIGDIKTPFYFYSLLDYALSKNSYLEPLVAFGITKDAQNFLLSLSYVYRFYKR